LVGVAVQVPLDGKAEFACARLATIFARLDRVRICDPRQSVDSPHESTEIALAFHIALRRAAAKLRMTDQRVKADALAKRKGIDVLIRFSGQARID
jgi:hypothetical protein